MVQEAEVSRQRIREDQLAEDLRAKISSIESALLQEKKEKDSKEYVTKLLITILTKKSTD